MTKFYMNILKFILRQFIPVICPSCGNIADSNYDFFKECYDKLDLMDGGECKCCGCSLDTILDVCSKCFKEESFP